MKYIPRRGKANLSYPIGMRVPAWLRPAPPQFSISIPQPAHFAQVAVRRAIVQSTAQPVSLIASIASAKMPPHRIPGHITLWPLLPMILVWLAAEVVSLPAAEHGALRRDIFCRKTRWTDVFFFFTTNYFLHSATVPSSPGRPWCVAAPWVVLCTLLPLAGYQRSVTKISSAFHKMGKNDDVHRALRQNAMLFVARNHQWKPQDAEEGTCLEEVPTDDVYVEFSHQNLRAEESLIRRPVVFRSDSIFFKPSLKGVHLFPEELAKHLTLFGAVNLPEGYSLALLDKAAAQHIVASNLKDTTDIRLGLSRNKVKMVASIA